METEATASAAWLNPKHSSVLHVCTYRCRVSPEGK